MNFLRFIPKERNGLFIIYELFSFDNFFRLLLRNGFEQDEAFSFVLANCSMSALVWQERIHNRKYRLLSGDDALNPEDAACKAIMIRDFLEAVANRA